jgi:hypothetical protein
VDECFDTSLIVLRFLASAFPGELEWMNSRIKVYHSHFNNKRRVWCVKWYYWLCLSEMPEALSIPEIRFYKDEILGQLSRITFLSKGHDKNTYTMLYYIARNCLSRLPEKESEASRISGGRHPPYFRLIW